MADVNIAPFSVRPAFVQETDEAVNIFDGSGFVQESFAAAGTIAIKTVNGLAQASVKTYNSLATASVKTWNGVSNV